MSSSANSDNLINLPTIGSRQVNLREFTFLDPSNTAGSLVVKADPKGYAHENKQFITALITMIQVSNGDSGIVANHAWLMSEGFRFHNVSCKEAYDAFWKAYADPFLSGGRIEFRNIMKHVEERRQDPASIYDNW
jgi:hypothetical protein